MPIVRSIGNITHDPKKDLYGRTLDLGHRPNGKRWRIRVTAKTKRALDAKVKAKVAELENGTYTPGHTPTLNQWWAHWCDEIAYHRVGPNTLYNYRSYGRKHIPHIGDNRLDQITPQHIRYLRSKMREGGASERTVQAVENTLSKALKDAMREDIIAANPCDKLDRPKANSAPLEAYTRAEVDALILTAKGDGAMMYSRWLTALNMGLRQSECLGLEWERVDLENRVVDVSWQLRRIPWAHGKGCGCQDIVTPQRCPQRHPDVSPGTEIRPCFGGKWFTRPKTATSKRLVPLSASVAAALALWQKECGRDAGLVWQNSGKPIDNADDNRAWRELCKRAGVRVMRLHSARHTMVSRLLDEGVDAEVIRQIAGHSTVLSTRRYMHLSQDAAREALERLG
ncbi:site-specific integrase [Corynebacterium incognita]|uniref:Site-specific integrase n=1 Tax=Corynebacterium incognita TaxID=2754725 RepID=A0A7G7CRT2_9CORY|nr:site-specific integrase [Corynebacterium incognita]QNE90298.1 site-specific integrase [Corynebacterium incognita]